METISWVVPELAADRRPLRTVGIAVEREIQTFHRQELEADSCGFCFLQAAHPLRLSPHPPRHPGIHIAPRWCHRYRHAHGGMIGDYPAKEFHPLMNPAAD